MMSVYDEPLKVLYLKIVVKEDFTGHLQNCRYLFEGFNTGTSRPDHQMDSLRLYPNPLGKLLNRDLSRLGYGFYMLELSHELKCLFDS